MIHHTTTDTPIARAYDVTTLTIQGRGTQTTASWEADDGWSYFASWWEDEREGYLLVQAWGDDIDLPPEQYRTWRLPVDTDLLRLVANGHHPTKEET